MKDCTKKMRRMAGGPSGALSDPFNSLAGGLGEEPNGRCYYCCGREKSDEPERQGQLTFRLGRRKVRHQDCEFVSADARDSDAAGGDPVQNLAEPPQQ